MSQFFVLGIGGTGMRCIESLLHLCAMGMFDDTELHLLALDTDKNNGNFARLKEVKEAYCRAKGSDAAARTPLKDTFFSANVKYYEFSPTTTAKRPIWPTWCSPNKWRNSTSATAIAHKLTSVR